VKYCFIQGQLQHHALSRLCRILGVSRSGYYHWCRRKPSARSRDDARLLVEIERVHKANFGAYGAFKTWRELRDQGIAGGKHRIARLRRDNGIEARRKRRFRRIIEHRHTAPPAPDLIERCFQTGSPNRAWVGDMTFIRTRQGWLYLATLLDLFSRKIVGWAMGERPDEQLTLSALNMAIAQRRPQPGLIHHTDQGVIYRARRYRERMAAMQMCPSMGAKGSAHDNAVAESFFSNLKNELTHHCVFETREAARMAIFDYIELFYNRRRLHQTLGYQSPMRFELNHECGT